MKPVLIHPQAKAELDHAIAYYESKSPGLGLDLHKKFEQATKKIQRTPESWPRHLDPRFRRYMLERFPYLIFYIERTDQIWILAVAHAKRRPNYWSNRKHLG